MKKSSPLGHCVSATVGNALCGVPRCGKAASTTVLETAQRPLATGLLAVLAATAMFLACGPADAQEPVPVHRQPFHIVIAKDSTPQTASATKTIAIHEKIEEVFKDSPIVWDPTERLSEATLVCEATGDRLAVGTGKQSPVYIEWTRHKLRKDEPGKLTVRVSDPKSLKPGVYRGAISAVLRDDGETVNRSLKVIWDVVVEVRGRRLVGVEFVRKKAGKPLRVGTPAGLLVTVNTVGCDLGQGRVKLDWWSAAENRRRALYVDLPLERPIDPVVHFTPKSEQGAHPQWRDCPVSSQVQPGQRKGPEAKPALDDLHDVLLAAPDCFLPGTMQAEIEWQQADFAANREPLKMATGAEPVLPGVLVFPSLAFLNEPVSVLVRTERDHGTAIPLVVSGPNGQSVLQLERRREPFPGSNDTLQEYAARYYPDVMGSYQVAWADNAELQQDLGEPAAFQACLGAHSALAGDLEVFASAPPFWITDSSGWKVILPEVFRFWYDPRLVRQAELEDLATFRGRPSEKLTASDPETEPNLQFWPHDESAWREGEQPAGDESQAAAKPPAAQTSPGTAESTRWPLGSDGERSPGLDMMVDLVREAAPDDPRHRPGRHELVQRMMIHARDTRGNQVYRIVNLPVALEVSTDWQYYRWILGGLGTTAVLVLISWYLYGVTSGPRVGRPAPPIEEQPDEPQAPGEYFAARPVRRTTSESAAPAAPKPEPPASEPSIATKAEASEEPAAPAQTPPEEDWWGK